ncbi:3176_t:CDS:2, partial [Racocetra persica]
LQSSLAEVDNYEKEQERNVKKIQSYLPPSSFVLLGNLIKYHALKFIHEMADIYPSEHEYDESSNNGVLECNFYSFSVLRLLAEIKNKIGTGKCDLTTQAGTSYAKYYTQEKNEKLLKWCNWLSFILCLAGSWVCVLGAVYVEKPIVDPLTDLIPFIPTNIQDHAER